MKFVNMTPHKIVIRKQDGTDLIVEPSGTVARVATAELEQPSIDGIPAVLSMKGEITGYPDEEEDTAYLVSRMVLDAVRETGDTKYAQAAAPDTGPTAIRDARGQVVAVTRLIV